MDFKIIHIDETDSTNGWLRRLIAADEHGRTRRDDFNEVQRDIRVDSCQSDANIIVVAEYQTAGKGCGKNSWESERGKNLTFSMLIHPDTIPANQQFRITETVSVALCKTLEYYIDNKVKIKWPNDIYVGDKKICGILIENRLQGNTIKDSIIGIGLNVNQTEFRSDAPNPVSLKQLTGSETDINEVLCSFLRHFESVSIREATSLDYLNRLFRRGKLSVYRDETGDFEATLLNVKADGRLLLRDTEGHERTYAFKEVEFIV